MIIVCMILWTLTFLMLFYDSKTISTRWAAFITFCGGCGGFARAWVETIMPFLREYKLNFPALEQVTVTIYNVGSFINTNGLPYAFLLFVLYYSNLLSHTVLRYIAWIAVIPIIIMLWYTPFSPSVTHDYPLLLIWVGPYVIIGTLLLIYSYINESNPSLRWGRIAIICLALPPILFQLVSNYILRALEIHQAWRFNIITIVLLFFIFTILLYRRGIFGMKLSIEKERIGSALKTLTSSTTLLQHTLKNETGKISILATKIAHTANDLGAEDIVQDITHIQSSAEHLLSMIDRLRNHAQYIYLTEKWINLYELINKCTHSLEPYLLNKKLITKHYISNQIQIFCDPVHMQEAIQNILFNAIEASHPESTINIVVKPFKKNLSITVQDHGVGISKEHMKYVFDPFFTTKGFNTNYGLGLTYSYKVIAEHDGILHIASEERKGTTVQISFSKQKFSIENIPQGRDALHE